MPFLQKIAGLWKSEPDIRKNSRRKKSSITPAGSALQAAQSKSSQRSGGTIVPRKLHQEEMQHLTKRKLDQTLKAEEEAHRKDQSIMNFENKLLGQTTQQSQSTININTSSPKLLSHNTFEKKRRNTPINIELGNDKILNDQPEKKSISKRAVIVNLANAIAFWDLMMVIMTFVKEQRDDIMIEDFYRKKYANCKPEYNSHWFAHGLYTTQAIASVLLAYAVQNRETFLILLWFPIKACTTMFYLFREAFELRQLHINESQQLAFEIPLLILWYSIQVAIVAIVYFVYTRPYIFRRQNLQSNRALNRDIFIKSLPPFLQRKYAVRWAEKLQTIIVLQKIRDRENRGSKHHKVHYEPTEEELQVDVEAGIKAFRSVFKFGSNDIDGEDTGSFTTRSHHPYHKRSLQEHKSKKRFIRKPKKEHIV